MTVVFLMRLSYVLYRSEEHERTRKLMKEAWSKGCRKLTDAIAVTTKAKVRMCALGSRVLPSFAFRPILSVCSRAFRLSMERAYPALFSLISFLCSLVLLVPLHDPFTSHISGSRISFV